MLYYPYLGRALKERKMPTFSAHKDFLPASASRAGYQKVTIYVSTKIWLKKKSSLKRKRGKSTLPLVHPVPNKVKNFQTCLLRVDLIRHRVNLYSNPQALNKGAL